MLSFLNISSKDQLCYVKTNMDISIDKARLKQNYQCTLFLHMTSKKLLLTVFSGYGHIK